MTVVLSLAGSVALVTGAGRSVGIGAAICRLLAQAGADIFFTYYSPYDQAQPWITRPEEPQYLLRELQAYGVRAAAEEADLSDPASPTRLFDLAESALGRVNILVNNATHDDETDLANFSAAVLDRHYALNVRGATLMCVEFSRRLEGHPGGRIINFVSGELLGPMPKNLPYAITKGAVDALTISLSASLAPQKITVNAIDPGPTNTGWMTPETRQTLSAQAPLGRLGLPKDAANLVLFLASPLGEWITGQILHSRGGF